MGGEIEHKPVPLLENCADIVDEHGNIVASLFIEEIPPHNIFLTINRAEERPVLVKFQ
jgi:hypothetical protein